VKSSGKSRLKPLCCTPPGWKKKFNMMDTPGYLDFMTEAFAALRVADFALVVVHAQHGVGVGTERVWNYATECGLPKIMVVNAMDKEHARLTMFWPTFAPSTALGCFR